MCVGALAFFAVGYGIAYGTDAGSLLGVGARPADQAPQWERPKQ